MVSIHIISHICHLITYYFGKTFFCLFNILKGILGQHLMMTSLWSECLIQSVTLLCIGTITSTYMYLFPEQFKRRYYNVVFLRKASKSKCSNAVNIDFQNIVELPHADMSKTPLIHVIALQTQSTIFIFIFTSSAFCGFELFCFRKFLQVVRKARSNLTRKYIKGQQSRSSQRSRWSILTIY